MEHWNRVRRLRAKGGKPRISPDYAVEFRRFLVRRVVQANPMWRGLGHSELAELLNSLGLLTLYGRKFDRESAREFARSATVGKMGFTHEGEARQEALALLRDVEHIDEGTAPVLHARYRLLAMYVIFADNYGTPVLKQVIALITTKLRDRGFPCGLIGED